MDQGFISGVRIYWQDAGGWEKGIENGDLGGWSEDEVFLRVGGGGAMGESERWEEGMGM